jgi:hypothetical protein
VIVLEEKFLDLNRPEYVEYGNIAVAVGTCSASDGL